MDVSELGNKVRDAMRNMREGSELDQVLKRWDGFPHVIRSDGVWRLGAIITSFQYIREILHAVDSTISPTLPPQCVDPRKLERFFRLPLATLSEAPQVRPGRKKSTVDLAEFAHERRKQGMAWKDICKAFQREYPDDGRAIRWETFREAYRRHILGRK